MARTTNINEDRQMDAYCLRAVLAYAYPRGIKTSSAMDILGLKATRQLDQVLEMMEDVGECNGELCLVDTAAERYDAIIRRRYA